MMRTLFNEKELTSTGKCYKTYGLYGGAPYSEIEYINMPITPLENFKRFLAHRDDYEWIPDGYCDYYEITPEINPDNHAMGYEGGVDSFGVLWEALENGLPALVRPGNYKLEDISEWESLTFPEPEKWGLDKEAENYLAAADHTRPFRGWINISLFERLIDVLGFENAAMGLLTDPEATSAFLDKVSDFNCKLIDYYAKDYKVDEICISDDWASQKSPFFSEAVARDVLLPPLKKMADRAHSYGLPVMLHSCGNGVAHIPVWIDAGINMWQFQENAVDIPKAIDAAGDKLILEGYWVMPEGLDEEGQEAFMRKIYSSYCYAGNVAVSFCNADYLVTPFIRKKAYELSRKTATGML